MGDVEVVTTLGPAYEGAQYLDLTGVSRGTITQAFLTTPNSLYELTFAYAHNYNQVTEASAMVRLFDSGGIDLLNQTITHTTGDAANLDWKVFKAQFTALQSTTTLEFASLTGGGVSGINSGVLIDAVQIVKAYNPATQFATKANPIGVWSYGYTTNLGSPLILHTNKGTLAGNSGSVDYWRTELDPLRLVPAISYNPSPITTFTAGLANNLVIEPGMLSLHPGPPLNVGDLQTYQVLRFTASQATSHRIVGSFVGQDTHPTTTDVHILSNSVSIFEGTVTGFGPVSVTNFDVTVSLIVGDTIDFVVGYGPNLGVYPGVLSYESDSTGLAATITTATNLTPVLIDINPYAGITINAPANSVFKVEFAERGAPNVWMPLINSTTIYTTSFLVIDLDATRRKAHRFYRVVP